MIEVTKLHSGCTGKKARGTSLKRPGKSCKTRDNRVEVRRNKEGRRACYYQGIEKADSLEGSV